MEWSELGVECVPYGCRCHCQFIGEEKSLCAGAWLCTLRRLPWFLSVLYSFELS